jgi:DNA repair protein RadA/Sms
MNMKKTGTVYVCNECGCESPRWNGKCDECGAWNSFEEVEIAPRTAGKAGVRPFGGVRGREETFNRSLKIAEVDTDSELRYDTGMTELNRVLGGGIVKGSLVLLGGEPGIGKSTLLLQICQKLGENYSILYVSGEESARQLKLRAIRLGVDTESLYILTDTNAVSVCDAVIQTKPGIVIIDSVQTMRIEEISSSAGSVTQVRECTNLFMHTAKSEEIPILIVGHVNKDGAIAGPKVMEHIVDAVLYFEGDRNVTYRILRAVKNRYGSTNEIGVFEMAQGGLLEVENPSAMLLEGRPQGVSGSCVTCVMEGTRPILAEVQALVTKSGFSAPRRAATGFDYNKMAIILAVLEKRAGMFFGALDVYINVVGGFKLTEPAADLSVALALYSALTDKPINEKVTAFGEIGLGGEIRAVSNAEKRIAEAARMGFDICIAPKHSLKHLTLNAGQLKIIGVSNLKQAFESIK